MTDGGTVLMDSTLILDFLDHIALPDRRLAPTLPEAFLLSQRLLGLALAACEKTVQIVYETRLRPVDKQHQPWLDRVERQLQATYAALEEGFADAGPWRFGDRAMQADITAAVAWRFTQYVSPGLVSEARHPALSALSNRAESTPAFLSTPIN